MIDVSCVRLKRIPYENSNLMKEWEAIFLEKRKTKFPFQLDIELTNRCNLKCPMCAFHAQDAIFGYEDATMDLELFKKAVNEGIGKGLKCLKLNYSGEALLYDYIIEAIEFAKSKGLYVHFNTNGVLLLPEMAKALIKAGLDEIAISDYNLPQQRENALMLQALKQLMKSETPHLIAGRIIYPNENTKAILGHKWAFADGTHMQKLYEFHRKHSCKVSSRYECAFLWQRLLILADGSIEVCCGMPHEDKHLGNAKDTTIEKVWTGRQMSWLRTMHKDHLTHLINACVECPMRESTILEEVMK